VFASMTYLASPTIGLFTLAAAARTRTRGQAGNVDDERHLFVIVQPDDRKAIVQDLTAPVHFGAFFGCDMADSIEPTAAARPLVGPGGAALILGAPWHATHASTTDHFWIPVEQVVEVGIQLDL